MRKNMMKFTFSILLVLCILLLPVNAFAYSQTPSQWAREAVINSFFHEIAYTSFIGDYDKAITREEFAMIAVNVYRLATGIEPDEPTQYTFYDISSSQYKDEIQIAKDLGIVLGTNTEQTMFTPSRSVTRQEICVMIFRLLQIIDPDYDYEDIDQNAFTDRTQIASWAIDAVDFAYNEGIMNGTSTTSLRISPLEDTTREQGMTLVFRMMDNWDYIAPVSQKLLDEINLTARAITIGSSDYLEDYIRDSLVCRKRDIRIWLSNGLTRSDIESKLDMILQEFEEIGYYYVPQVNTFAIALYSPIYVITVDYENVGNVFPESLVCSIDSWDGFDEKFLLQVRSGITEAAYTMEDVSMRDPAAIRDRMMTLLNMNLEQNYVMRYEIKYDTSTPGRYMIGFEFAYDVSITRSYLAQVREYANSYLKENIRPGMTAMEKELAINDHVVGNTRYYTGTEIDQDIYYEYGVFFNKEAVCQGYSSAIKLLLNMAGIYSINVIGTGNGQAHAWNIVKLYGDYYHLDATWNDPVPDVDGRLRYDYLNVTQQEILQNHTMDTEITYPSALGTRYNYHEYIGAVFDTPSEVVEYIEEKILGGVSEFTFKISNYSSGGYVISDLIRQAYSDLGITSYSVYYSPPTILGVVNVKMY